MNIQALEFSSSRLLNLVILVSKINIVYPGWLLMKELKLKMKMLVGFDLWQLNL